MFVRDPAAAVNELALVDLISTYFRPGNREQFTGLFTQAGPRGTDVRTLPATVRAPTVDACITIEVESTPLIERISDDVELH